MKYFVAIGGKRLVVDLLERDGRTYVVHEGREVPADLVAVRGTGAWSLLLGTQSHPLVAAGPDDDLLLTVGSETWRCSVQDEREALVAATLGTRAARRGGGVVRSVMPGIVREMHVEPGAVVARGASLVILEAMKMQNEIRADAEGVVAEVHVRPGTAVAKGDPLVTLR